MHPLRLEHRSGNSSSSSSSRRSSGSSASSQSTDITSVLINYSPRMLETEKNALAEHEMHAPAAAPAAATAAACRGVTYVRHDSRTQQLQKLQKQAARDEDLSPSTNCYPRASTDTYASTDEEDSGVDDDDDDDEDEQRAVWADHEEVLAPEGYTYDQEYCSLGYDSDRDDDGLAIIPPLPTYRHDIVDNTVRPTTPQGFAQLFPSTDRMSVRHDEFTSDGNMNLRVDMAVPVLAPGHESRSGAGRRRGGAAAVPVSYQLFHLRMYDLARRSFSLRRYCRDSGREVCSSKLMFDTDEAILDDESTGDASSIRRSMTSALRSLGSSAKPVMRRAQNVGMLGRSRRRPGSADSGSGSSAKSTKSAKSIKSLKSNKSGPSLTSATSFSSLFREPPATTTALPARPRPTNTVRLEFSNYARVDVTFREAAGASASASLGSASSSFYDFEWWGHQYTWVRVEERHLPGVVQFHLLRDYDETLGPEAADVVAHIVPEPRSPNQEVAEAAAGGWVPACHMWISDPSVLAAMTDVADVIMATGLVALVDDCIRMRWPTATETRRRLRLHDQMQQQAQHQQQRRRHSSASTSLCLDGTRNTKPHAFLGLFHRRNSHGGVLGGGPHGSSPLRQALPVRAY